jgi:hypothetical protein
VIRDPAGLLARIQELEPLCSDPRIRRAVEKGDPFKVYRALWWARLTGKLVAHRRTLDLLLGHRRAFAKPLAGKTPMLGTFNGFGATLLGASEKEADGTSIATHCVVALFVFPVFPLGAYVVAGGERKVLSSSWTLFARVPLGTFAWLSRRAIALAVVAAVAWGGATALWASGHRDVTVVNGLAVPVRATIGKGTRDVAPGAAVALNVPLGTLRARAATAAGTELESFDLPVSAGRSLVLWNVAGAAPVYEEEVEYFATPPGADHRGPRPTLHCGDRVFEVGGIDYAFQAPPSKVSMPQGASRSTRRHLDVATGLDAPSADFCATALLDSHRESDALRVLEARARARGMPREDVPLLLHVAVAAGPAEGERVARAVRAAIPDDVMVQRSYQFALEAAGKLPELVAEYRGRAEAAPESPKAQYLHLRLLEGAEQLSGAEAALEKFPKDPDLLRLVTALRAEAGDFGGAAAAYRALRVLSPEQAVEVLHETAASLVRLGRGAEALSEIAAIFDALPPASRGEPAVLYARVAALQGLRGSDALVRRLEEKAPDPVLRARAGLPPPSPAPKGSEELVVPALYGLARKDPRAALEKLKPLPPALVGMQLDSGTWALLFFEAVRTDVKLDPALLAFAPIRPRHLERLKAYVRGEAGTALPTVPIMVRAAAELVRSRNAALPEPERAALAAAARADDPLAPWASEAIARWPAAGR